jgi:hypothetical protein
MDFLAHIVKRLAQNDPTLVELELSDPPDTVAEVLAQAIAGALHKNSTLKKLNLHLCFIGDAGAQEIAGALRKNSTLKELNLFVNDIGDAGAQEIAGALHENSTLTELCVGGNCFGDAGAQAFAGALRENSTLERLDLQYSVPDIGLAGGQAITDALRENSNLMELYFEPGFDALDAEEIKQILEDNSTARKANRLAAQLILPRLRLPATTIEVIHRYLLPQRLMVNLSQGSAVAALPDGNEDPAHDAAVEAAGVVKVPAATIEAVHHTIEAVHHAEPAAQIDEVEAAEFVKVQEAGFVEWNIGIPTAEESPPQNANESTFLSKLNRIPKHLRDALCYGKALRRCREDLEREGLAWKLPNGALVFVKPEQYGASIEAIRAEDLKPDHILFTESFEYLIEEALADFKDSWARQRTDTHARARPELDAASEAATGGTLDQLYGVVDARDELVTVRTFVCHADDAVRLAAQSVAQSTTEAHGGINPRTFSPVAF